MAKRAMALMPKKMLNARALTEEAAEDVGAERVGGVICLLKHFCEDQTRKEDGARR